MTNTNIDNTTPGPSRLNLFSGIRRYSLAAAVVGLLTSNVATLLHDDAHSLGFRVLQSLLGMLPLIDAHKVVQHSPTVKRTKDVEIATTQLKADRDLLAAKHSKLETEHQDLKTRAKRQAEIAKSVSTRIASRSVRMSARNVASVPGESLPVIGTTLVIGVTTLDIIDLCQTLKDVNELNAAHGAPAANESEICGISVPSQELALATLRNGWKQAYQSAANAINTTGNNIVPASPPAAAWGKIKDSVCTVFDSALSYC